MSTLKAELRDLQAQLKRLKTQQQLPEVAQERAATAELIRECESKLLIQKATRWGIEVPDKPDWYSQETKGGGDHILVIEMPYLNDDATAILTHRIRKARFEYWKGWAEVLITVLSLIVAIIALLIRG